MVDGKQYGGLHDLNIPIINIVKVLHISMERGCVKHQNDLSVESFS